MTHLYNDAVAPGASAGLLLMIIDKNYPIKHTFDRPATSLHNPDFVDVAVQSYRHRHRRSAGDPRFDELEAFLATTLPITVPPISLDALADGFGPDHSERFSARFTGSFEIRKLSGVDHNVPQEAPMAFADAVADLVV